MPAQETSHRYQKALLWERTGYDQAGQPVVSPFSVQLDVRWNDKAYEALDPQGNTIKVDVLAVVDRDILIGSVMWLGTLEDLAATFTGTGTANSTDVPLSGLMQVIAFDGAKDLKGRAVRRTVGLMRWSDSMPTQGV